jgi:O-antigen/teichoic acid export membrane protein
LGAALLLTGQRGPSALLWLTGLLCGQALSLAAAAGLLAGPLGHPAQLEKARAVQAAPVDDFRLRSVWAFSWPLVICTALYWVQRSSFGPWLAATGGVHELGLFSVAFSVGLLTMAAADTVFTEYYSPLFYRRLAQGGKALRVESWNAYAHALLPALVIMFVCIAANGLPLLQLLVPGEFQGLPMVAACGAVSQLLISAYSLQMLLASSFMDNRLLILPNAVGAAVTVALMTLLVPELPVAGAALAVMAGLLVTNGGIAASLHQRYANRWPVRRMAGAAGAALPMFGVAPGLDAALPLWPPDGRAALALALCAAYAAALQYGLARPWWRLTGAAA